MCFLTSRLVLFLIVDTTMQDVTVGDVLGQEEVVVVDYVSA